MSAHEAVEALRELGLSNYEARVFVALQRLGTGTAQEVSQVSDVPRSQVYGAADDLAGRGLLEVVESSPKAFRPVSLATAREQLTARLERERERAFENLDAVDRERSPRDTDGSVSTLRGARPIRERAVDLVADADEQVMVVGMDDELLTDALADVLRGRAAAGVSVMAATRDAAVEERFADDPVRVMVVPDTHHGGFTGRTLLVDDATVLLSVPTDDGSPEPFEEIALWTAETRIGRILARFIHAGMQSGFDDYPVDASVADGQ
jgi:sugar-specific transcriptional regulator TrmB